MTARALVAQIPVGPHGQVALVDDEDVPLVEPFRWKLLRAPHGFYAMAERRSLGTRTHYYMHTVITGYSRTDHINGDGLDNRRLNLRAVTRRQNGANRRKRSGTSQFKGVSWDRLANRWRAQIKVDIGRTRYLGIFVEEIDAASAYDTAARVAFGEYAALNFPNHGEQGALERGA